MRGLAIAVSLGLTLVCCLMCAGPARAQPAQTAAPTAAPAQIEARVRELLASGVEQSVTPQMLAKLGPALPDALLTIFERPSEARHVRLRALSMLAHHPQTRVTQLFARLLREGVEAPPATAPALDPLHASRSTLVLRRAIEGIAVRKVPAIEGDLMRALAHRDAQVRRAAVLALGHVQSASVREALAMQRARETSPLVLKAFTDRSARSPSPRPSVPRSATPPR